MILFVFLIGLILITSFFRVQFSSFRMAGTMETTRKRYIICVGIFLILITTLRNVAIGPDTFHYATTFYGCQDRTWESLFQRFTNLEKDPFWLLFNKATASVLPYNRVILLIVSTIFFGGFCSMLYRNTKNITQAEIGFLVFALLFLNFSFTAHRQLIALGVCMYSFKYIQERNLKKFIICMAMIFFLHKSSMLFWPYYYLANIRKSKNIIVLSILILPILFLINQQIAVFLGDFSGEERYMAYSKGLYSGKKGALNFMFMVLSISFFYLFQFKSVRKKIPKSYMISNCIPAVIALMPLAWIDPTLMRVTMYYTILLPLVVIISVSSIEFEKIRSSIRLGLIVFVFAFSVLNWQKILWTPYWQPTKLGQNYGLDGYVYEESFFADHINYQHNLY